MFEIKIIGSSSSGNSYLLSTTNECLMLECGVRYKSIFAALDFKIKNIVGCLVSHEHKDHAGFVKDIIKAGIDVYSSAGTLEATGIKSHRFKAVKAGVQFTAGRFTILPFETQHDCAEGLGYLIQHEEIGKLLFATDTYYIRYKFNALSYIMLECNYSRAIVEENLRTGVIERGQVHRLFKSHFSLERVKEFLAANNLSELKKIYLMHLSNRNSNAELFQTEIEKLTGVPVEIC